MRVPAMWSSATSPQLTVSNKREPAASAGNQRKEETAVAIACSSSVVEQLELLAHFTHIIFLH